MKRLFIFLLAITPIVIGACSQNEPGSMVLVKGGTVANTKSNLYGKNVTMSDFYIGRYEVTQKEWSEVMGSNPSNFKGDTLPVEKISWYDCVEYCNKRSIKEGLKPYYNIDKNKKDPNNPSEYDKTKWTVTINAGANGYRLPTEVEWEYASGGGQLSKSYTYSGSDKIDEVAWYWQNSGDKPLTGFWNYKAVESNHCKTKAVGVKAPNELGLYDMSGNVREWCYDWYGESLENKSGTDRVCRGGGWLGGDFCGESSYRSFMVPDRNGRDLGLRVCRDR
jgi:sulfatase modifying factor 1